MINRVESFQFEDYVANKVELNKSINKLNYSEALNETKPSNDVLEADIDILHELTQQDIEDNEQENIEDEKPKMEKEEQAQFGNIFLKIRMIKHLLIVTLGIVEGS